MIEDDSGSVETADWQAVRGMEPAGIQPATSCLQSPSGSGRLRVGCGSRPETLPIPDAAAGLAGSNPGGRGVHQASSQQRRAETRKQPEEDVLHLWVATHYPASLSPALAFGLGEWPLLEVAIALTCSPSDTAQLCGPDAPCAALTMRVGLGVVYVAHALSKPLLFTMAGTAQFLIV